jgi:hypothetical protein
MTLTTPQPGSFTPKQKLALRRLRARYEQGNDRFDDRELARMRFLRWLCETGRISA